MSQYSIARDIILVVTGQELAPSQPCPNVWSASPPGYDISVVVRFYVEHDPLVSIHRYTLESEPTDPETARAIFAALCHLGCA